MSDTPRTDKAASLIQYAVVGEQYAVVTAEFARELERESANLAKAYVAERDELLKWKARALEAERPTAQSESERRWMPVSHQPEPGQDVLAWCGWHITATFRHERARKPTLTDWHTEDGVNPIFHVTHWMPLPENP